MIEVMSTVHHRIRTRPRRACRITESELARDVHGVLERCGKVLRLSSRKIIDPWR